MADLREWTLLGGQAQGLGGGDLHGDAQEISGAETLSCSPPEWIRYSIESGAGVCPPKEQHDI